MSGTGEEALLARWGRRLSRGLLYFVVVLWLAWTVLTLWFSNLQPSGLREGLALAYAAGLLGGFLFLRRRPRGRFAVPAAGVLVSLAYLLTLPSNERDWVPDVAQAVTTQVEGNRVTVRGVRNFSYRSETDFDEVWEERTYDLDTLQTLDLFMSYWGPTEYCHTILSFGFEGGEQLAASVEVRKEQGETFSTYGGFFKQFELSYIFADERDVIGVRTNHRKEEVYLYRLRAKPERLRALLLSYCDFANELAERPQFYDVIENSCGVNILHRIAERDSVPWSQREALFNGYWDQLLYQQGAIDQGLSFEDLRRLSHVNDKATEGGLGAGFEGRLRAGLPDAPPAGP